MGIWLKKIFFFILAPEKAPGIYDQFTVHVTSPLMKILRTRTVRSKTDIANKHRQGPKVIPQKLNSYILLCISMLTRFFFSERYQYELHIAIGHVFVSIVKLNNRCMHCARVMKFPNTMLNFENAMLS